MNPPARRTKIIFTVGPATESEEVLEKIFQAGADVCRINMAHATPDWTREIMRRIRTVSHRTGREIAIMMDIKGPGNPDRGSRGAHRT
jgi:pyruvate kinase